MLIDEPEVCYFSVPGKDNICTILSTSCTGTRSRRICKFFKTEKEFYEQRNRAVKINRRKGNCANCKYKKPHCEIVEIESEKS